MDHCQQEIESLDNIINMKFGLAQYTSREVDKEAQFITSFSDNLETNFHNKAYGKDINEIIIGVICVSKDFEQFFKPKKPKYTKDKKNIKTEGFEYEIEKCLEYSIKIDFNEFKSANDELQRKKILSREILLSLSSSDSIKKKIKDFNWEQFKQDLENYFKERNLI